jgi:hypothetical protein
MQQNTSQAVKPAPKRPFNHNAYSIPSYYLDAMLDAYPDASVCDIIQRINLSREQRIDDDALSYLMLRTEH